MIMPLHCQHAFPLWLLVMRYMKVRGVQAASVPPFWGSRWWERSWESRKALRGAELSQHFGSSKVHLGWDPLKRLPGADHTLPGLRSALAGQARVRNCIAVTRSIPSADSHVGSLMWLFLPQSLPGFITSSCIPWGCVMRAGELPLLQHSWFCLSASCSGVAASTLSATDSA